MEALGGHGARVELLVSFPGIGSDKIQISRRNDKEEEGLSVLRRLLIATTLAASRMSISVENTIFQVGMDFGGTGGLTIKA